MTLPIPVLHLKDAINSHDPARVAACFTHDYRGELPQHPSRNVDGAAHVKANYETLFARIPDVRASVLRTSVEGDDNVIWSEWEMTGTETGGDPVDLVGPVIMGVRNDKIAWTRFYIAARDGDDSPGA